MNPRTVAERLKRAEAEYLVAQLEHDGSDRATVRYQQARAALRELEAVARAMIDAAADGKASNSKEELWGSTRFGMWWGRGAR